MKYKFRLNPIIIILTIILYLLLVNFIFNFWIFNDNIEIVNGTYYDPATEKLGFSDSVDISVKRPRFYGTYYENYNNDEKNIYLKLFNIIKLPIRNNALNFVYVHLLFLLIIFLILISGFKSEKGGQYEKNI